MKAVVALLLLLCCCPGAAAASVERKSADEAAMVAAYLFNFGRFVHWPDSAFASADAPLQFCLYGETQLDDHLDSLRGKRIRRRTVAVQRLQRGDATTHCHLLFISASERLYLSPLLRAQRGLPVLTVSEIEDFASDGGVIGLLSDNRRLAFEINTGSAADARLSVSSQLLKLAKRVLENREGER
ncbi:MAG: YfiR family protein [Halioglobus sp.]|nr:YfiR family protein [Halioglobus sp.]